jgi:hypothetical protein
MSFKCQVSAAARALFNSNAHEATMFSLEKEKGAHLMGQLHCNCHYVTA